MYYYNKLFMAYFFFFLSAPRQSRQFNISKKKVFMTCEYVFFAIIYLFISIRWRAKEKTEWYKGPHANNVTMGGLLSSANNSWEYNNASMDLWASM